MKPKKLFPLCCILIVLALLVGCSAAPREDLHPEWDADWLRFGDLAAMEHPAGFTLNESNDVLSAAGLWYATWTQGNERKIVSDTGRDAKAYDAQIYLIVKECKDEAHAEQETLDWLEREQGSYETGELSQHPVDDQCWRILPLLQGGAENPYTHGAAAFAVRANLAICVELLCADSYDGDVQAILESFLQGFHFAELP